MNKKKKNLNLNQKNLNHQNQNHSFTRPHAHHWVSVLYTHTHTHTQQNYHADTHSHAHTVAGRQAGRHKTAPYWRQRGTAAVDALDGCCPGALVIFTNTPSNVNGVRRPPAPNPSHPPWRPLPGGRGRRRGGARPSGEEVRCACALSVSVRGNTLDSSVCLPTAICKCPGSRRWCGGGGSGGGGVGGWWAGHGENDELVELLNFPSFAAGNSNRFVQICRR